MRQFKPGQLQSGSLYPITASAAVTASYAISSSQSITASFSHTASYVTPLQQNVIITGSIYIPDNTHSIYFSGSNAASRLVWNDTDGTLDLGLKGGNVTLQIGQEQVARVVNKTGADLLESQYRVVRIRRVDEGGAQGQRLAIVLAQANNDANSVDTLGIVTENITNNEEGFITTSGLVRAINTTGTLQGETWTDGDVLYLSPFTPGILTKIKPEAPNHTVIMGYVVYAHNNQGKIFVKVDNGYEIDELHNVRISTASLAAGQLLVRSGSNATGIWINSNQLSGSYSLTGSLNASAITGSFTGSFRGDGSQLTGIVSSKWTGSNPISRQSDVEITGSLRVQGSITGSLFGTASFAITASTATTASHALTALTATTSSHALESNTIIPLSGLGRSGLITFVSSTGSAAIVRTHQTFNVVIDNTPSATVNLTGSLIATSITSSLQGTASFAVTASHALNSTLPAGSTGWIQFKGNSGNFDASSEFVFDKTYNSLTNGKVVTATGLWSHAEGDTSKAIGDYSHAEGSATVAVGQFSHAEGNTNTAGSAAYSCSITLGVVELSASYGDLTGTYVDGTRFYYADISTVGNSIYYSIVTGSFFNGTNTIFQLLNDTSTTINPAGILDQSGDILNIAGGFGAHVEGNINIAVGDGSHAEGQGSRTWGEYSHAEGSSITYGAYSHAEGSSATTYGAYSHAEGSNAITIAAYSHAEGQSTYAGHQAWYANVAAGKIVFPSYYGDLTSIAPPGSQLLVEDGVQSTVLIHEVASIIYSGSGETEITLVDSTYDPQVGLYVGLVGNPFLTYGDYTIGSVSHAEGQSTTTLGNYSHAEGLGTTAHGYYQTVVGQYNAPVQVSSSFVIGNGDSGTPSNLLVAYGNTVQVTGSIGIHNVVSATLTSLSSSFGTTPATAYSIPVQPNGGAWFEYVIRSGSNARTGQIMAVWDDTLVNFTDTTTTDLGDTSGVTLTVTNDTSNITFDASATTDDWSIKAIIRSI